MEVDVQQQSAPAQKVALVFGGSRGIGEAIVRRLAKDGAAVALTYVAASEKAAETVRAAESEGVEALAIRADSADADAIRDAVEQTLRRFGRLDIVVVNAGILMRGTIDAFSLADFDKMVAVNVRGVFAALHFAAPLMEDGGRIITIGSNTAIRTGLAGGSIYSMTKAAVAVLVRGAAIDLAPRRITVNNIQPGPTATDMTAGYIDLIKPLIPLGRLGEPAEVAGLVAYLASDEAGFITGSSVTIDGGYVA
jgi:3-oxoacyl-[acyl-carrier protein] reductase